MRIDLSTLKQRLLTGAAPVLLVAIASAHLHATHAHGLTPWKGGGFGMFSTVDSRGARFVRTYIENHAGDRSFEMPVRIPNHEHFKQQVRFVRAMPVETRVQKLAKTLASLHWGYFVTKGTSDTPPSDEGGDSDSDDDAWRADNPLPSQDEAVPVSAVLAAPVEMPTGQPFQVLAREDDRTKGMRYEGPVEFTHIRVEIWRFAPDGKGMGLTTDPLVKVRVPHPLLVESRKEDKP